MRRFFCCVGLLVISVINLFQFIPCTAVDINVQLINCTLRNGPFSPCTERSIITEIGETLRVRSSGCSSCTLALNTTRQNRIRLDIDIIRSLSWYYKSYIVHDGVGTVFTKDVFISCYLTFPTNELDIYMDQGTSFRISTAATHPDSLDSTINTTIVTNCEGLIHFDAEKEPDVSVDLICSDPECTKSDIITDFGGLLAVDTYNCQQCTLAVNTTMQNRIRLDIANIGSLSAIHRSYTVHDGVGTVFTKHLTSCYITIPTNELEISMDRYTRFSIRTEATNQHSLDFAVNTSFVTDCVGLIHFDAEKEPDVNADLICSDQECTRDKIITEIGDLLAVHSSYCESCTLTVNTTIQNRIRLDIINIGSMFRISRFYIVYDGVGTVNTKHLNSCYLTIPTNELEIYMDQETIFRITTESTNQDSLDATTNTTIATDCVGLIHVDAEKEPDVNVDLICSDQWCTTSDIIAEFGDLLAVDTSRCDSCTLTINTTSQNRIRLDIDNIEALSQSYQSYILHDDVRTVFTKTLASCYVTFPTNKLEIYMDRYTRLRISAEATDQDSLSSATNTTNHFECAGLLSSGAKKEPDDNDDVLCPFPFCTGTAYDSIITAIDDLYLVDGRCISGIVCTLTVNTRRQKRIRFNVISIQSQFSVLHDRVLTQFTENPGTCYITFPTNELVVHFTSYIHLIISEEDSNQVNSHWNTTSDCAGLVHFDSEEVHVIEYDEMELYIENDYKEIQSYMRYAYGTDELRGALPLCPYNCTCSLNYQQLMAHCDNKTKRTLLFHNLKGPDNISYTFDASKRQLDVIDVKAFKDLKFIHRLILNKNLLTRIESATFSNSSLNELIILEIADNMITEFESDIFIGLTHLRVLDLHGNRLTTIPSSIFQPSQFVNGPANILGVLDISNNSLVELLPETFTMYSTNLNILILDKNNITTLYPNTFKNVLNLAMLYLDDNQLTAIAPNTFPNGLQRLHLSGNQLSEINLDILQIEQFGPPENELQELTVSKNGITSLPHDVFCYTPNLQRLSIAGNQLQNVDLKPFANLKQLTFLNISENNLKSVLHGISRENRWKFCNNFDNRSIAHLLPNMQDIDLNNNEIQMIEGNLFKEMPIIETVLIRGNPLQMVDKETFASLKNETNVLVDDPSTCCFIEQSQCKPQNPRPPYLTCLQLLSYPPLKVFMWIFGLFALVGNLSILLWRCTKHGRESIIQVLLIGNLAASDLMMGVYMLIIASADAYYQQYFPSWSNVWRNGPLCKLAGTLSVLSSEASVFFITLISIDRFLAIKYPRGNLRLTRKSTRIVLMCLWSLALLLSALPVSFSGWNHDFYDISEVCIGLPFVRAPMYLDKTFQTEVEIATNFHINIPVSYVFSVSPYIGFNYKSITYDYSTGLEYEETYSDFEEGSNPGLYFSIALFLGINLVCFFIVAVTYTWIFITFRKQNRKVGISRTDQEIALAKRMGAIIITDFMCWAPIIVIGILVQSATITIKPVVYVYFVVFLLPINSALNPYIYTVAIILSDYSTRTRNSVNKRTRTRNKISLTRTTSSGTKSELAKKRKDLTKNGTERVSNIPSTSFSRQPKSPATHTKSDVENNVDLASNETVNVPELAPTSFSDQPKSPESDTHSDAEIGQ